MPENALEDARFDHVSETGELVFVSGAGKFAVKVDEALERAIWRQSRFAPKPKRSVSSKRLPPLPISQSNP